MTILIKRFELLLICIYWFTEESTMLKFVAKWCTYQKAHNDVIAAVNIVYFPVSDLHVI